MQSILQQGQSDPKALQDHMKNPGVRAKINKVSRKRTWKLTREEMLTAAFSRWFVQLVQAGIIKTR